MRSRLAFTGTSDLLLMLYTPVPGTDADAQLARLLDDVGERTPEVG